jgi:bacillopeptidase F
MSLRVGLSIALVLFVVGVEARAAQIDPALVPFAQGRTEQRAARVVITVAPKMDGVPVPRRYDTRNVVAYLRALSSRAQTDLKAYLGTQPQAPSQIRFVGAYWINSTLTADVTPLGLRILAQAPDVTKIYLNRAVQNIPFRRGPLTSPRGEDYPYPYVDIGLDKLIQSDPGIDGHGVLIGHIDTGVDGTHPALQGKIFKFWDSKTKAYTTPVDSEAHGSHTAGTIVGGDRSTVPIGVAPGARLLSSGPLNDFDGMLASMQLMLDPDGDPQTNDQPRAVSCSWHAPGAPDMELFYTAINSWEAAGILPVFAAGNDGPGPNTIADPQSDPAAFVIGATGADGKITSFSSRGPATYHGQTVQKPDVTAPGDNVRSSVPGGGYEEMSGTSMATPHAAGTSALVFQVDPGLTPDQVRKILLQSTIPLNGDGTQATQRGAWNATYGLGKLNAYNAVQLAKRVHLAKLGIKLLPFLASPEDQSVDSVLEEENVGVADLLHFMGGDSAGWINSRELFP